MIIKKIFLLISIGALFCLHSLAAQDSTRYDSIWTQLMDLPGTDIHKATVNDYRLTRAQAEFALVEGNVYLLSPVNNCRVGVMFYGTGRFIYSPPIPIEQEQLYRFYETDTLDQEFEVLFMIFSDSTARELQQHLNFSPDPESKLADDIEENLEDIFEYIADEENRYFRSEVLHFLLNDTLNNYFYAHFFKDKQRPFMFEINPYDREDVRLIHRAELGHVYKIPEVVCQHPLDGNYNVKDKIISEITHFDIDTKITRDMDFSAVTRMNMSIKEDNQKWFAFNIYYDMLIDSVFDGEGNRLIFFKPEETLVFWVEYKEKLMRGDSVQLIVHYHCDDLLHRDRRSWIYLKAPNYWYPRNAVWTPSVYKLRFQYPADMTLVSIGEKIDSVQFADTITAVWRPDRPVTHAVFNIGYFDEYPIREVNLPEISILKTENGVLFRSYDIEQDIARDITGSIAFYRDKFGPPPFKRLYVSEVPYPHGMAFQGLLNLSWTTFHKTDYEGYDQIFRAHEVAHQWWGIAVKFASYHDQWLSESFAEFSGLWFLQKQKDGMKKFNDIFDAWLEQIITNRKYILSDAQEAGPIWLGARTVSSYTEGDYDLIIYKKGAWVLHMLRMMLHDWNNKSDKKFENMMQDYYYQFRDKKVSTDDFKRIVESHIAMSMDWFFEYWIYGTEIPRYKYAYKVEENMDSYNLDCAVVQDENQRSMPMPMTVEVVYTDGSHAYFDLGPVEGKVIRSFELTTEPDEVNFNPYHAILGELEEFDFEDL